MAQTAPPQLPSEPSVSPARPAAGRAHQRRWLAACLLILIAATAITGYLLHSHFASPSTTLQGEVCPAPGETEANSCQLPEDANATREPFPAEAAAQVGWVLRYEQPAMVLFYSHLCRPCMMMYALVQMVRRDYEPAITFIEVVSDQPANAALVRRMGVGTIPASVFLTPSGGSKRVVGLMKQQDLRAELAALVTAGQALLSTPTGTTSP